VLVAVKDLAYRPFEHSADWFAAVEKILAMR
jgi:hypothetical protein